MSDDSDSQAKGEAEVKVSWVYKLNKEHVLQELLDRGFEAEKNSRIDELRKLLVKAVRENVPLTKRVEEDKSPETTESSGTGSYASLESHEQFEMANENAKLEFSLGKDDWEIFVDRLEILFTAKDIKDEKKAAVMLTRFDEDAFKLIKNLCTPNKPAEKSYAELKKIMSNHLAPVPSEVMERCKFNQARQENQESVAEFAARLKKLSLHCNFKDLSISCRDQFVCGIRDQETRIALFKIENLTFDTALKEAQARESAVKNALTSSSTLNKGRSEMYKFNSNKEKKGISQGNKSNNTRGDIKCYRCNRSNHLASECRF